MFAKINLCNVPHGFKLFKCHGVNQTLKLDIFFTEIKEESFEGVLNISCVENFGKVFRKHLLWRSYLVISQPLHFEVLCKIVVLLGVFLRKMLNFLQYLARRTLANSCFWKMINEFVNMRLCIYLFYNYFLKKYFVYLQFYLYFCDTKNIFFWSGF